MKALTFWRPWSDAIVRGPKRCENRGWPPPDRMLGEYIAIHAGKRYQRGEWPWPDGFEPPAEADSPQGIVGVARIRGALDLRRGRALMYLETVDELQVADRLDELDRDPWWAGPCGWLLDEVVAIEPVPCRGAQGLWNLPADVELVVRERWEEAKAG